MKRHRTHQIDDLAQRVLRDALHPSWVLNEQHNDYGKDYLVEIGEDNGDLTGSGQVGTPRMNAGLDALGGMSLSLRRACDWALGGEVELLSAREHGDCLGMG